MGVGTYDAYIERMKQMKPNIYLNSECVDRMGPWNEAGFWVMKQCYDMANDPAYADVCTRHSLRMESLWRRVSR